MRAGYKAMWLEGVALLSHQLDDLTVPIISEMDMGESPIYHSATFGLQLDW